MLPLLDDGQETGGIAADVIRLQENIDLLRSSGGSLEEGSAVERGFRIKLMEVERYLLLARMLERDGDAYYKTVAFMVQSQTLG